MKKSEDFTFTFRKIKIYLVALSKIRALTITGIELSLRSPSGFKELGIRKTEFVLKTQFLLYFSLVFHLHI